MDPSGSDHSPTKYRMPATSHASPTGYSTVYRPLRRVGHGGEQTAATFTAGLRRPKPPINTAEHAWGDQGCERQRSRDQIDVRALLGDGHRDRPESPDQALGTRPRWPTKVAPPSPVRDNSRSVRSATGRTDPSSSRHRPSPEVLRGGRRPRNPESNRRVRQLRLASARARRSHRSS